jgi:hypothetical protein
MKNDSDVVEGEGGGRVRLHDGVPGADDGGQMDVHVN